MFNPWVGKISWRREWLPTLICGLENSTDYIVHGVTKSRTRLSDFHFQVFQGCKVGRSMAPPKNIEKSDGRVDLGDTSWEAQL